MVETRRCLFELIGAGLAGCRDRSLGHPSDLIRKHSRTIRDETWTEAYEDALVEGAILVCGLLTAYKGVDRWQDVALVLGGKNLL